MDKSEKELINAINHYKESLHKYSADDNINENKLLYYIGKLHNYPVKIRHLEETGIGLTVNGLRKLGGEVADSAKNLITKWKKMVVEESNNQDDDDDDNEDDDEDEDDEGEDDDEEGEEEEEEEKRRKVQEKRSDKYKRTEEKERRRQEESNLDNHHYKKEKHKDKSSSSHKRHHSSEKRHSSSASSSKVKDRKEEKHQKRKQSESSNDSDDDSKKVKKKRRNYDSEQEESQKNRYKLEKKVGSSSNSESEELVVSTKEKVQQPKSKDAEKSGKRKHESSSSDSAKHRKSDTRKTEKSKDKHKAEGSHKKETSSKHSKDKHDEKKKNDGKREKSKEGTGKTKKLIHTDGIDSESGASFAEALGMLEPSTSKVVKKKVASPLRVERNPAQSSSKVKSENLPPALLKPPQQEPLDISLSSLLPTITPNYRPLGSIGDNTHQRQKANYDDEALSRVMSSKNQRTKVYSGNKSLWGYVPTLFELCTRVLQDNIDALEYTGGVPYSILKPVLERATPNQLFQMEHHNPYLIEDTDELWQLHCAKEFKNKRREELESWREMYMRCLDEREAKLIALTANIKQSQDKSMPVRQTKLAYVDSFVKPPREIARRQAKNGTKNAITPSLKLTTLATAGAAGQVAVPNPGARAVERSAGSSSAIQKPKKAPLMQKALAAIKNRFRR